MAQLPMQSDTPLNAAQLRERIMTALGLRQQMPTGVGQAVGVGQEPGEADRMSDISWKLLNGWSVTPEERRFFEEHRGQFQAPSWSQFPMPTTLNPEDWTDLRRRVFLTPSPNAGEPPRIGEEQRAAWDAWWSDTVPQITTPPAAASAAATPPPGLRGAFGGSPPGEAGTALMPNATEPNVGTTFYTPPGTFPEPGSYPPSGTASDPYEQRNLPPATAPSTTTTNTDPYGPAPGEVTTAIRDRATQKWDTYQVLTPDEQRALVSGGLPPRFRPILGANGQPTGVYESQYEPGKGIKLPESAQSENPYTLDVDTRTGIGTYIPKDPRLGLPNIPAGQVRTPPPAEQPNLVARDIGNGRQQWFDPRTGTTVGAPFGGDDPKPTFSNGFMYQMAGGQVQITQLPFVYKDDYDGAAYLIDPSTGQVTQQVPGRRDPMKDLHWTPDGRVVGMNAEGKLEVLFSLPERAKPPELVPYNGGLYEASRDAETGSFSLKELMRAQPNLHFIRDEESGQIVGINPQTGAVASQTQIGKPRRKPPIRGAQGEFFDPDIYEKEGRLVILPGGEAPPKPKEKPSMVGPYMHIPAGQEAFIARRNESPSGHAYQLERWGNGGYQGIAAEGSPLDLSPWVGREDTFVTPADMQAIYRGVQQAQPQQSAGSSLLEYQPWGGGGGGGYAAQDMYGDESMFYGDTGWGQDVGAGQEGQDIRDDTWDDEPLSGAYNHLIGAGGDDAWQPPVRPEDVVGTGHKWLDPVSMEGVHKGLDLQLYQGKPALSPVNGQVSDVEFDPRGLGLQVSVASPQGETHKLSHLLDAAVQPGQAVGAGEQIARIGSTGAGSTGPHLDYRIQDAAGNYVNPEPRLGPLAQMPRADNGSEPTGQGQAWQPTGVGAMVEDPETGELYDDGSDDGGGYYGNPYTPPDIYSGYTEPEYPEYPVDPEEPGYTENPYTPSDIYGGYTQPEYPQQPATYPDYPTTPSYGGNNIFNEPLDWQGNAVTNPPDYQGPGGYTNQPGGASPPPGGPSVYPTGPGGSTMVPTQPTLGRSPYVGTQPTSSMTGGGYGPGGSPPSGGSTYGTPRPGTTSGGYSGPSPEELQASRDALAQRRAEADQQYQLAQSRLDFDRQVHGDTLDIREREMDLNNTYQNNRIQLDRDTLGVNTQLRTVEIYNNWQQHQDDNVLQRDLADMRNMTDLARLDLDRAGLDQRATSDMARLDFDRFAHGDSVDLQNRQMSLTQDYNEARLGLDNRQLSLSEERNQFDMLMGQQRMDMDWQVHQDDRLYKQQDMSLRSQIANQQMAVEQARLGISQQEIQVSQGRLALDQMLGVGQLGLGQDRLTAENMWNQARIGLDQARLESENAWREIQARAEEAKIGVEQGRLAIEQGRESRLGGEFQQTFGLQSTKTYADIEAQQRDLALRQAQMEQQAGQFGQTFGLQESGQQADIALRGRALDIQQQQADQQAAAVQNEIYKVDKDFEARMADIQNQYRISGDRISFERDSMALEDQRARELAQLQATTQTNIQGTFAQRAQEERFQSALRNPWLQQLTGMAPTYGAPGGPGAAPPTQPVQGPGGPWQPQPGTTTGGGVQASTEAWTPPEGGAATLGQQMGATTMGGGTQAQSQAWQPPSFESYQAMTPFQRAALRTQSEVAGVPWEQTQDQMRTAWGQQGITQAPQTTQLGAATQNAEQRIGTEQVAETMGQRPEDYWNTQQRGWSGAQATQVRQAA